MYDQRAVRPFLLRVLPDRLRLSVWARLYRGSHQRPSLYEAAPLTFAPAVTMRLVPGDVISDAIAYTGIYELPLTRRVMRVASAGGTMIEVGANLGYFALLWAAGRAGNRCVAFEPSPRNLPLLEENVRRNGFESVIRIMPQAAGAASATMSFDLGPDDQTGWGGLTSNGRSGVTVSVVRVDEVVDHTESIALLKVDAEGADTWVLKGCERLLRTRAIREVWYEQNKPRMAALGIPPDAAQRYLRSLGYLPSADSDPDLPVVGWRAVPGQ